MKKIEDLGNLNNKKVLLRLDLNVPRGATPRGEVAKPITELAHRDRFIKVASGSYGFLTSSSIYGH